METLNFSKDYILEDNCVKLSPLKLSHTKALAAVSGDPEIWTYFFENGSTIDSLKNYIENAIHQRELNKAYPFVVFDKIKNQIVGTTRFYEYSAELNVIKSGHTWYGKATRGTGINKHCKFLLFEFAFEKLGVERVGFGVYADHKVSLAALKSVGCKKEGVLRNMFPALSGVGRTDAILMSILKKEWLESEKQLLLSKLKNNN